MKGEMNVNQQQSSNGAVYRTAELLIQHDISKRKHLTNVEVRGLTNDTVELHRSKRSKGLWKVLKGKKGSKGKKSSKGKGSRNLNKYNTKENREKVRDVLEEFLDDDDDDFEDQTELSVEQLNLELINSVKKSNLNEVKEYISKGADINTKDRHGKTSLHIAAKRGLLDISKYLVDEGADIGAQESKFGREPLHLAAAYGHLDIVKCLVEKGADVNRYEGGGSYSTVLHFAVRKGHFDVVKYLIEKGANPNAGDGHGKTPLQWAVEKGISDIVEYLKVRVKQVTEVPTQITEEKQFTTVGQPLATEVLLITEGQQVETRKQQVTTTEVPETTEDYSEMSLHFAAEQGYLNAVKYLVENGADINASIWNGSTPLLLAVQNNHLDVVRYLVEKGADVDLKEISRNAKGWAPLHFASYKGYLDIVKYLTEKGADVNKMDNYDSNTPLHSAVQYGHLAVVEELLEKNAIIDIKNKYGYTPLHKAALNGYLDVVKKLAEKGADVNNVNNNGYTPSDTARSRGFSQVAEFLSTYQPENRYRRDVVASGNSWLNYGVVNWVKGLVSSREPLALFSTERNNNTVTVVPEINTTVVNNTVILGILATGLFNKTRQRQQVHENLLSPIEQLGKRIDEDIIIRAIKQAEEKFGGLDTN